MGSVERIGVAAVNYIFETMGFVFREQPVEDYGIDAIVEERLPNNQLSGKLIGVQIKSGKAYFEHIKDNKIVYYGNIKHYHYWKNYALPVIIILYNPENNMCIYDVVNEDTAIQTDKGWKIEIDRDNELANAYEKLRNLSKKQSEYNKRLSTLVFSKGLMNLALEGRLIIEVQEWINKCSGKGDFIIKSIEDSGEIKELYGKTIYGFGVRPYEEVLPEVFPWADLVLDEEYYNENGDSIYMEEMKRQGIRVYPYMNTAGEVDWYRFRPVLNKLGESFMCLDDFLNEGNMYNISFDESMV